MSFRKRTPHHFNINNDPRRQETSFLLISKGGLSLWTTLRMKYWVSANWRPVVGVNCSRAYFFCLLIRDPIVIGPLMSRQNNIADFSESTGRLISGHRVVPIVPSNRIPTSNDLSLMQCMRDKSLEVGWWVLYIYRSRISSRNWFSEWKTLNQF